MAKEKPNLTEQQRAERVLSSHGRAAGMLASFPVNIQQKLTTFCSAAGEVKAGSWDEVERVMRDYWDSQKATVEAEEVIDDPTDIEE